MNKTTKLRETSKTISVKVFAATIALLLASALVAPLSGCSILGGSGVSEVKAQAFTVGFAGVVPADSGKTYGEVIEAFCPGGSWKQAGDSLVNYEGGKVGGRNVDIQWSKSSSGWRVYAMEVDGTAVPMLVINGFFSAGSI